MATMEEKDTVLGQEIVSDDLHSDTEKELGDPPLKPRMTSERTLDESACSFASGGGALLSDIELAFIPPDEGTPAAEALAANAAIKVNKVTKNITRKWRGLKRPKMKNLNIVRQLKKHTKSKRKNHFSTNFKGKVIDGLHELYTLTIGMMLGVRCLIGSGSADNTKDLTLNDFNTVEKRTFPPAGNTNPRYMTPPHALGHTFKFKSYSPKIFRRIREFFGIEVESYMMSVCGNYNFLEFISNSKSNQFFFYSHDGKYMIKTLTKEEVKFMKRILPHYYKYLTENPHTFLVRFLGMHRVKMYHLRRKVHFVIMGSVFDTAEKIHTIYDLKGSLVGREATEKEKKVGGVLKDKDLINDGRKLHLGEKKAAFIEQLRSDARFLATLNIMDYSLLVGIHDRKLREIEPDSAATPSHSNTPFRRSHLMGLANMGPDHHNDNDSSSSDEEKEDQPNQRGSGSGEDATAGTAGGDLADAGGAGGSSKLKSTEKKVSASGGEPLSPGEGHAPTSNSSPTAAGAAKRRQSKHRRQSLATESSGGGSRPGSLRASISSSEDTGGAAAAAPDAMTVKSSHVTSAPRMSGDEADSAKAITPPTGHGGADPLTPGRRKRGSVSRPISFRATRGEAAGAAGGAGSEKASLVAVSRDSIESTEQTTADANQQPHQHNYHHPHPHNPLDRSHTIAMFDRKGEMLAGGTFHRIEEGAEYEDLYGDGYDEEFDFDDFPDDGEGGSGSEFDSEEDYDEGDSLIGGETGDVVGMRAESPFSRQSFPSVGSVDSFACLAGSGLIGLQEEVIDGEGVKGAEGAQVAKLFRSADSLKEFAMSMSIRRSEKRQKSDKKSITFGPGFTKSAPWTSRHDNGINSRESLGIRGDEIYYLGVIDILQQYNLHKRGENFFKGFFEDKSKISSVDAAFYAERFVQFVSDNMD